jgi:divalent metal cation (Fe/Co/Zn/Cd) transporter
MDKDKKSSYRTLLLSVVLSSYGPIILGYGLTLGHSSTQISDFTRRTAELLALIVALVVYMATNKRDDMDEAQKKALERKGNFFCGIIMCISGLSMLVISFIATDTEKGNVLLAMLIAFFGVVANSIFWRRYTLLFRKQGNAILGVQARLYGAKSAVDVCVTLALAAVLAFPGTKASYWIDCIGSVLVSLYMLRCGIKTITENLWKKNN